jgi:leader peptidase (prepilin peptidase)/N-methyltransferase
MLEMLQSSPAALIITAAFFGVIVGSFLNVVILRLPARLMHDWQQQSREFLELDAPILATPAPPGIVREPSHCPRCRHALGIFENIPLLSWVFLRGRCKHCGAPISAQYPLVELLTAVCSALIVWKFGWSYQSAAGLILTWTLIALAGIDLHTQLLPDNLTLPLLWFGLLIALLPVFVDSETSILGAAVGYMSLWSVYWLFKLLTGKEGMGHGDFKLLGALGAWMGWASILPIVLLSSLIGALIGGGIMLLRGQDRSIPFAFGPFIAVAGWVQFMWGGEIITLWQRTLGLS